MKWAGYSIIPRFQAQVCLTSVITENPFKSKSFSITVLRFQLAQATRAKCLLLMGDWGLALESAEQVLEVDKNFVKAILVKAESLYNTCDFEHALIYYHRGQVPKLWFTLVLVLWMSRTSQQIISLTRLVDFLLLLRDNLLQIFCFLHPKQK